MRRRSAVDREDPSKLRTFIRSVPHLVPVTSIFGGFQAGSRRGGCAELENFHPVSPLSRSNGSSIRRVSTGSRRGGCAELENFHTVSPSSLSSGSSIRRVSGRKSKERGRRI